VTVVEHPRRQTVELNRRIAAEFGDKECWRASIDLEMILILEFGDTLSLTGKSGPITIGSLRILVHGEDWLAERKGRTQLASHDVLDGGDELAAAPVFVGRRLSRFDWSPEGTLTFSDNLLLRIGREVERPECSNIVEFRFPNGDCVDCFANGNIATEADV
jgi:hypothetical protein